MFPVSEKRKNLLTEIIKENQNSLYRLAYSHVRNEDAAKDVVQETILSAFKKLPFLKEEAYMKTWLIRICINKSLDTIRSQNRMKERTVQLNDFIAAPKEKQSWQHSDLFAAIMKLDKSTRTVILLRYFEEMKFEEISQVTGMNINTVKSRVYKGLDQLKNMMKEEDV